MGNVVSITRKGFLAAYRSTQKPEGVWERLFFFTRVLLCVVLPSVAYCGYDGPVPPAAFAVCATAGLLHGLVMYRRAPYQMISCLSTGTVPRAPLSDVRFRKAA